MAYSQVSKGDFPIWSKRFIKVKSALGASMSGGLSVLAYLCQTTKRANKYCATNIAKQQTPTTKNKK